MLKHMKRLNKLFAALMPLLLAAILFGACSKKDAVGKVYLLNFKPEIDAQWKEVIGQFSAETGIEAKVVTAAGGTYEQTLRSEITKSDPPTLFNINGPIGYLNWKTYTADMKDTNLYSWLSDKSMAISADGGVYGLPYAVETYGIIYNDAIFRKYFALSDRTVTDISSAAQIDNFAALKAVVEDMTARKFDLGIDGVFASTSFRPGEDWRWQTHLANLPIYYEYRDKGVGDLDKIELTYGPQYRNIFDLYINNSVTDPRMIGSKSVDDSMSEFALGKVAMVQNGTWGWGQIAGIAGNVVQSSDVKYMPIYTGVRGEETQGLCTGTENFICVNAKSSKASQEASLKLLEWLFNTPNGKKAAVEKLGFVTPFSTFGADERPDNPLEKEAFRFMSNPNLSAVSWNFTSFPSQAFKDDLGAALYDYALGNKSWDDVAAVFKNRWEEEKALLK
ncbi:MAG: ABC transporter substrate-binding protein [Treponema sp.]|jgi:raffinose/stachyose/melibiose transport system substrate-binding protein|nr:ABC transporter substrate-binding protein [Treponema sp.]